MEPLVAAAIDAAAAEVERRSADAQAWGALAQVLHAHGELALARQAYDRACALDSNDARWVYGRVCAAQEARAALVELLPLFETARLLLPNYAPLSCRLGQVQMLAGVHADAARAFSTAIEHDPELALAHRGLGHARLAQDEVAGAIQSLERALELQPDDAVAWAALARAARRAGDAELARTASARAADTQPTNHLPDRLRDEIGELAVSTAALLARADRALASGDPRAAAGLLERVATTRPEDAWAWRNLALARRRAGDSEAAEAAARRALLLSPGFPLAQLELGKLAETRGAFPEALEHYRAVVAAEPENGAGWARLAATSFRAGDTPAALEAFERGAAVATYGPEALTDWGVACLAGDRPARARELFEQALAKRPDLERASVGLARAQRAEQD